MVSLKDMCSQHILNGSHRLPQLAGCYIADFINTFSCNPDRLAMHVYKLRLNIELADRYHKQLYLGATKGHGVKTFEDKRLLVWQQCFSI